MDTTTPVKTEAQEEPHLVKIEEPETATVVFKNMSQFEEQQVIQSQLLQHYECPEKEGSMQLVQLEDGQFTYIIEQPEAACAEEEDFDLPDSEHYIIEEYVEEYEEPEYTTVYVESLQSAEEEELEEDVSTRDVYTISEEVEDFNETSEDVAETQSSADSPEPTTEFIKIEIDQRKTPEERVPVAKRDEINYECSICSKSFRTPQGVKMHISVLHAKEKPGGKSLARDELSFSLCSCCGEPSDSAHTTGDFTCDKCGLLFILQNSLERHKCIEHPIDGKYQCYDCKRILTTKDLLIEHTKVHSLKSVKCEDCGREFSRKYHLDRHIGQTGCMGLLKQVYECRVCGKSFTRKDNLAEHLKGHAGIMNKRKKVYTCEFCMKEFTGLALLQIHVRTHTGERPYGCDVCDKKFPSCGALKKHRRKHTGEKPYTCPQCGVKFAAKETLNRHWRTHTGDKPHKCQFCGKAFIQAAQLRAHIFHHTGENAFVCPHCNRAFNRKLRLTTHIKFMHEGAEPLPCPQAGCRKTFFRKEDIHRHLLTHSGDKPYKCDVCDKAFTVKSSLKVHQNIHKKEQPVACEICHRGFIRRDCLMRHMRARHRDFLEDIVSNVEKKRLQSQLLKAVADASMTSLKDTIVWNELTLTESIKELLSLLVDKECLKEFGYPDAPVDRVLETVIKRCGHEPAVESDFDYIGRMRENAKLLFTVVIDDKAVSELFNNQSVDEVIMHVLKLTKKQATSKSNSDKEDEVEIKPTVELDDDSSVQDESFVDDPDSEQDV